LKNGDKGSRKSGDSGGTALLATSFAVIGIAVIGIAVIGIAVVVPNYRLSPKATFPAYIQDAAAAVVWVRQQMPKYGADSNKFFVGGHSAGGYLLLMLAMKPRRFSSRELKRHPFWCCMRIWEEKDLSGATVLRIRFIPKVIASSLRKFPIPTSKWSVGSSFDTVVNKWPQCGSLIPPSLVQQSPTGTSN